MMMTKRLSNQNGFTLTNMVVGLAIGAVVMAAFVSTIQMMTRSKQSQDVKMAASMFIDELQQATKRASSCKNNITNATNHIDMSAAATPMEIQFGNMKQDSEIAKGVRISKLAIKKTSSNPIVVPGLNMKSVSARMEVAIVNDMTNPPTLLRTRYIPMQVLVDPSDIITGCAELDSQAQVCAQLDGVWDDAAPAGLKCIPTDKCLYGGSYSLAPANGLDGNNVPFPGYTNTFTNGQQSCPPGYSAQQTGTVSVAKKSGKYHVTTDTYPNFTCVLCHAPVPNQALTAVPTLDVNLDPQGEADALAADNTGGTDTSNINTIRQTLGLPIW